ncbi:MAG: class A beta-lactamase-related serine hydrolase [Allomuricauda sp.]|nr:MAG: class A beta-lactamase-related serine hydrolase [Allomuricauda sp.]
MKKGTLLLCLMYNLVMSQNITTDKNLQITKYLGSITNDFHVPGMVVAISNSTELEYLNSFGAISTDNNFIIGSNSKSFTALIVLRLQEKGLLSIDDPVVKYLPWFEFQNTQVSNKISIKNLLNHTSGLSTEMGRIFFASHEKQEEVQLKITDLIKSVAVDQYPIERYDYSNLNYQLLGFIIEKVSGKEYNLVFKEEITEVFDLKNTSSLLPKNLAQGYQPFLYYSIIPITSRYHKVDIPMGYINSNANDLSTYTRELMNAFNHDTTSIISHKIAAELFRSVDTTQSKYALGWHTMTYKNCKIFSHGGLVQGFNSAIIIAPELEKSIVVLTNHYGESAIPASLGVLSLLLNKKPTQPSRTPYFLIRSLPFLVLLFIVLFTLIFKKWLRNNRPHGVTKKPIPNILAALGLLIGLSWTLYLPNLFRATIRNTLQFDITSGLSLVLLSALTLAISIILYFNSLKTS